MTFTTRALLLTTALGVLSPHLGANAQTTDRDEDVVIVTAQRQEQSLQEVPLAVTALTGRDIAAARIEDTLDLQFNAPNVILSANRNLTIRGVGSQSFGGSNDTNIGVLYNGVFLQSGSTFGEFFDLERIEVLRGPQGTLFGRNTTGGVLSVVPAKPKDEFGGYLSVQLESYEGIRSEGALNIPLGGGFSQRFAAHYLKRDGYTENLFNGNRIDGRDQYTLRSTTRYQNADGFTADLFVTYFHEDSDRGNNAKALCAPDPIFGCSPDALATDFPSVNFPIDQALINGIVRPDTFAENPSNLRQVNFDIDPETRAEDLLVSLELNKEFGALTLTSVTGYRDAEGDGNRDFDQGVRQNAFNPGDFLTPFGPLTVPDNGFGNGVLTYLLDEELVTTTDYRSSQLGRSTAEQFSQEVRLASDYDGALNFLLGAYYLDAENSGEVTTFTPANRTFGFIASGNTPEATTESYAVFGEVYIDLTDNLQILGGARYTEDEKSIQTASGTFALPAFFEDETTFEAWTGRASISWSPELPFSDESNLYATYQRGFKSGGFNPGNVDNPTFDSEFIDAFEIGAKSTFANGDVRLNLAAFHYDYENLIVGNIVGTLATNVNIPEVRVRGFEAEMVATPTDRLRLEASLGVLDTEVLSDFLSSDPTRGGAFFQLKGNELPNAPNHTIKLAAEYVQPLANGVTVRPRVDYYTQGSFYSREFNTGADELDGWDQLDLQVQFTRDDAPWQFTAFVKNVLDEDDITFAEANSELVGSFRGVFLLDPRVIGAQLRVSFD
ncbi:MAG: TonB-dependent receptor [Pseudomonadota bacterium]